MKLPRNAQIWWPGYVEERIRRMAAWNDPSPQRVWLTIADHYEPMWRKADLSVAAGRVRLWRSQWPAVAASSPTDSADRPLQYTFFYPEEEYQSDFLDQLAEMTQSGIADVEVHIHHDGEGRQNFIHRMTSFCDLLYKKHGLLRESGGKMQFGFIHGNWALDNSLANGRWCGLNDEIQILHDLGCYADFTMPSGDCESQSRMVNQIYWCTDDPARPKSYDTGLPLTTRSNNKGDLLLIPGPFGLRWAERLWPRLETGELAANDLATRNRVKRWFDLAPRIGLDVFIKLYTHGAQERNSAALLSGGLKNMAELVVEETKRRGMSIFFVTAWQMYRAVTAAAKLQNPVATLKASV